MLTIEIRVEKGFDNQKQEFVVEPLTLQLEHSLASLSKWESFWEKPFLGTDEKTTEETLWYIKAMSITPDVPPEVYDHLSPENFQAINEHIGRKMTATWFSATKERPSRKIVTAELIYYWMTEHNIPFECENWHLNRLLTLLRVCNVEKAPAKKMSRREAAERQRQLNAQRKAALGTTG